LSPRFSAERYRDEPSRLWGDQSFPRSLIEHNGPLTSRGNTPNNVEICILVIVGDRRLSPSGSSKGFGTLGSVFQVHDLLSFHPSSWNHSLAFPRPITPSQEYPSSEYLTRVNSTFPSQPRLLGAEPSTLWTKYSNLGHVSRLVWVHLAEVF